MLVLCPFALAPILERVHGVSVLILVYISLVRQYSLRIFSRPFFSVVLQAGHAFFWLAFFRFVERKGLSVIRLKGSRGFGRSPLAFLAVGDKIEIILRGV